jgi:hypothetical protein
MCYSDVVYDMWLGRLSSDEKFVEKQDDLLNNLSSSIAVWNVGYYSTYSLPAELHLQSNDVTVINDIS